MRGRDFDAPAGKGVTGTVEGRTVVLGNRRHAAAEGVDAAALEAAADDLRSDGATAIFVAIDGKACRRDRDRRSDQGDDAARRFAR